MAYTNELLSNHKESWGKHGSSIMSGGWTNRTNQSLINILVNYSTGTIFVKSIDASCILKTKEKTFELLDYLSIKLGRLM